MPKKTDWIEHRGTSYTFTKLARAGHRNSDAEVIERRSIAREDVDQYIPKADKPYGAPGWVDPHKLSKERSNYVAEQW